MRRRVVWVVSAALLVWSSSASAGPQDRFQQGVSDCVDKSNGSGSFSCSICGVNASCSGGKCSWGTLSADVSQGTSLSDALALGYQLYCINSGGAVVTAAAPAGIQSRAIDRAISGTARAAGAVGGVLEYGALKDASHGEFGAAVPIAYRFSPSLDLTGNVFAGTAPGLSQVGVNARAGWVLYEDHPPGELNVLVTGGVPTQLLVTTGSALSTSAGYHFGGTMLAALSTSDGTWGGGVAVDALYTQGFQVPALIAGRYAFGSSPRYAVQPAVSFDVTAPGASFQQNVLAGVELGSLLVGAQVFLRGDGNVTVALGVSQGNRVLDRTGGKPSSPPLEAPGKPGEATPVGTVSPGGPCERDDQCEGTGACVKGACRAPRPWSGVTPRPADSLKGDECKTDKDCAGDATCEVGYCLEPGDEP